MKDVLTSLDAALMEMRRLWSPTTSGRPAQGAAPGVDLSTVLVVHVVGEAANGLAIAEVADRLGIAAATASRLSDRAVAGGYLRKMSAERDARRRTLTLSDAGLELRDESAAFRRAYLARVLAGWTADEIEAFERLLTRFAAAVVENPPQPTPLHLTEGQHR
ncbi:MarR family winged helix-turn-helix transcriptional regulator [Microbacterium sp. NPDC055988]|uniref:MarR family winged helix-turn-helix transcriptional regulator n=1 Tax=Microbacterium sp. NPDC055988 TaxID=3345671 RepID=UPI0035D7087D